MAQMWRGGSMALHVYMRACTHVGMYTCGHVVHMQACTHACTHVCMYMSTHTHRIPVTIPSQGCVKEAVRSMQTCPDFRVIYKSHELPTQTAVGIRRVTPPFGGEEVEGRRWREGAAAVFTHDARRVRPHLRRRLHPSALCCLCLRGGGPLPCSKPSLFRAFRRDIFSHLDVIALTARPVRNLAISVHLFPSPARPNQRQHTAPCPPASGTTASVLVAAGRLGSGASPGERLGDGAGAGGAGGGGAGAGLHGRARMKRHFFLNDYLCMCAHCNRGQSDATKTRCMPLPLRALLLLLLPGHLAPDAWPMRGFSG